MVQPDLENYRAAAKTSPRVPVWRTVLADTTTVVGAYWKIAHDAEYSFLLESVTGGEQVARYSVIGANPVAVLKGKGSTMAWSDGYAISEGLADPLRAVAMRVSHVAGKLTEGLPRFFGGAVGTVAYDYVRTIEDVPDNNPDELGLDDVFMMLTDGVVVFDHAKNLFVVMALADGTDGDYERCVELCEKLTALITGPLPALPKGSYPVQEVRQNTTQEEYEGMVRRMVEYIGAGDAFQGVPSLRFSVEVNAPPITIYRALRSLNPSPYMFLIRGGDFDVVGASPEVLVGLEGRKARVRPIAGTRWRGKNQEEDETLAEDLLADTKERAEHIMLVDLGRNDIGRVSEFGSVSVDHLMVIEKYSHVMHIVSEVTGTLRADLDSVDLFRSAFPLGTVSGAPKVRAMEIIDELEKSKRGLYAGAVGYLSASGSLDTAVALRTIVIKDGVAHVQAGAGVVWDSNPTSEYTECCNKAAACLKAIEMAQKGL